MARPGASPKDASGHGRDPREHERVRRQVGVQSVRLCMPIDTKAPTQPNASRRVSLSRLRTATRNARANTGPKSSATIAVPTTPGLGQDLHVVVVRRGPGDVRWRLVVARIAG